MKGKLRISLKANEKIYINGAVVKVDRKTSIEFLNDVQFLLENHVMLPENASTPLRQLYFIIQVILMNPNDSGDARDMFRRSLPLLLASFSSEQIRATLKQVDRLVAEEHTYEALKMLRGLFPLEAVALAESDTAYKPIENLALEALAS
ncbi:flagellar biosynthesis repressor FlbT [Nitratireductor sp. CAU 1489]|uniref:Probable flagellum biosynthesis repressor protein FlbT n=1 Tax=Nitratireductor arenosus TaxID=2682096 RepID=A0A844QC68_9HYPH|nr:flagellar biosynthesis repressor FlbT [Nitratireductor arenosus]MVA95718.1 flagellar biosynthesis repressor FlbT [Nitratireductor arenosus]